MQEAVQQAPYGCLRTECQGAKLVLRLAVPDVVIQKLGPVTLSARAGDTALEPETFAQPGNHVYERPVPAEVMIGDAVTVEFALDKALAPGQADQRELGIIVTAVGFEPR